MTVSETDYNRSRREINRIIEKASNAVGNHLENVVLARAEASYKLIQEWYEYYSKDKAKNLYDNLLKLLLGKLTDFFESVENGIGLYDLNKFVKKSEQEHLEMVLDRITKRGIYQP